MTPNVKSMTTFQQGMTYHHLLAVGKNQKKQKNREVPAEREVVDAAEAVAQAVAEAGKGPVNREEVAQCLNRMQMTAKPSEVEN